MTRTASRIQSLTQCNGIQVQLPQVQQHGIQVQLLEMRHCEPSDAQKLAQNRNNARAVVSWTHPALASF